MRTGFHGSVSMGLLTAGLVLTGVVSTVRAQGFDQGRNMFGSAAYYPGSGWNNQYYPGDGRSATYSTRDGKSFFADRQGRDWHTNGGRGQIGPGRIFSVSGQSDRYNPYGHVRPERPGDRHTGSLGLRRWFHGRR